MMYERKGTKKRPIEEAIERSFYMKEPKSETFCKAKQTGRLLRRQYDK